MRINVKRAAKAVLALLFGYSATWVAFSASDSASSDEKRGALLGPLDFSAVCRELHGDEAEAIHLRLDAYGWRCFFTADRLYQQKEINIDQACSTLFDGDVYSKSWDVSSADSWECFRGPPP